MHEYNKNLTIDIYMCEDNPISMVIDLAWYMTMLEGAVTARL
jgi:hypothetical protein